MASGPTSLGGFLKDLRLNLGWSLRDVQARTGGRIHNAYLSQIESGKVGAPAVETLVLLAEAYGVDLWSIFHRAGWVPERPPAVDTVGSAGRRAALADGVLEDLTDEEVDELVAYAEFLKARRGRRTHRPNPRKR